MSLDSIWYSIKDRFDTDPNPPVGKSEDDSDDYDYTQPWYQPNDGSNASLPGNWNDYLNNQLTQTSGILNEGISGLGPDGSIVLGNGKTTSIAAVFLAMTLLATETNGLTLNNEVNKNTDDTNMANDINAAYSYMQGVYSYMLDHDHSKISQGPEIKKCLSYIKDHLGIDLGGMSIGDDDHISQDDIEKTINAGLQNAQQSASSTSSQDTATLNYTIQNWQTTFQTWMQMVQTTFTISQYANRTQ